MKYYRIPIIGMMLPFDKELYFHVLKKYAGPIFLLGLVIIYLYWGEILLHDFGGLSFSTLAISYIIHILIAS